MKEFIFKVFEEKHRDEILKKFNKCNKSDIHNHPDYLILFKNYTSDKLVYFYFENKNSFLLIPYFVRKIDEIHSDLVSPWYYGGPIFSVEDIEIQKKLFEFFLEKFNSYCETNNIVCEFQRFNPLLKNYLLYETELNKNLFFDRNIVYCDLRKNYETLEKEYARSVRKNIKKAVREGLKVISDESEESILKFINVYQESMKLKNANKFYFFNTSFFFELFNKFKGRIKLFHVIYNKQIISSTIVLGQNEVLYDYLRGANPNYISFRPNDLVIDRIIRWAQDKKYKLFSLGGGASNKKEDGVLRFKQTFSVDTANFYIYKKIYDMKKYEDLCKKKNISDLKFEMASFFPEYLSGEVKI